MLPDNAILIARNLGPAELLEYDRTKLKGLLLEEGSSASHAAMSIALAGVSAACSTIRSYGSIAACPGPGVSTISMRDNVGAVAVSVSVIQPRPVPI